MVKILKFIVCILQLSFTFFYHHLFVTFFCLSCYFVLNDTMAEANGIRDLPREGIQSILDGYSDNDSKQSLPQVPNETWGLSSR